MPDKNVGPTALGKFVIFLFIIGCVAAAGDYDPALCAHRTDHQREFQLGRLRAGRRRLQQCRDRNRHRAGQCGLRAAGQGTVTSFRDHSNSVLARTLLPSWSAMRATYCKMRGLRNCSNF